MKIKRNVLICAALLLAAFWLNLRWFYVHLTPAAAFRDYFLGLWGRTPTVLGTYDGDGTRFYFVQDNRSNWENGDFAAVYWANQAGPFWRSGSAITYNEVSVPRRGMEANAFQDFACVFRCDPDVDRISLRVDYQDGRPSLSLPTPEPYGKLYFWYLPDHSIGEGLYYPRGDYKLVFTAYDKSGRVLDLWER